MKFMRFRIKELLHLALGTPDSIRTPKPPMNIQDVIPETS